jgi:hypothetical protein
MGTTTVLRQRIRKLLEGRGFVYDGRHSPQCMNFRRTGPAHVHLLAINWAKAGKPRFVAMFSKVSQSGVIYHGELVSAKDLLIEHSPTLGFLAPKDHRFTSGWFRLDPSFPYRALHPQFRGLESVVEQFSSHLAEIEEYWSNGTVGPHIRFAPEPRPWVANAA